MIASPTYNLRIKSPAIIQRKIALYNAKGALPLPSLSDWTNWRLNTLAAEQIALGGGNVEKFDGGEKGVFDDPDAVIAPAFEERGELAAHESFDRKAIAHISGVGVYIAQGIGIFTKQQQKLQGLRFGVVVGITSMGNEVLAILPGAEEVVGLSIHGKAQNKDGELILSLFFWGWGVWPSGERWQRNGAFAFWRVWGKGLSSFRAASGGERWSTNLPEYGSRHRVLAPK